MTTVSEIEGFVLTRQWQEIQGDQHLVFWLSTESGPVKVTQHKQESVFFVRTSDVARVKRVLASLNWRSTDRALLNFHHEPVTACYFPTQKILVLARTKLRGMLPVYEADVRPTDRYLMERFITAGVLVKGNAMFAEGAASNSLIGRGFINPRLEPADYQPTLTIASLDIETSYTENILYSIAVHSALEDKVFMVGAGDSALSYLEYASTERLVIERFLEWFAVLDPDVIIGWSVVGFDLDFLQKRCDVLSIPFTLGREASAVSWRNDSRRPERRYALVPGRVVLDGIELLRTATYQFESFALDFVAHQLLGRGKLIHDVDARASEIQDLYANDADQLARYNLEDCVLVREIFDHTDLFSFAMERSRLTGLDMDRAGGSVAAFDYLYLPRLHRQGYVGPVVEEEKLVGSPGGFVLDSQAGIYNDVIVLDFKSLYPSIIRTFHVDPLAMIAVRDASDAIPGFKGAEFSRHQALLPAIIEELWAARDVAKASGREAMSQAIKIIMNSFYGVLGTPGCRFFDTKLVSSITLRGHEILQTTRDLINDKGMSVIYGDTDSVFVHLKDSQGKVSADEIGGELVDYLNDWWREHLLSNYNIVSCLEVEFETHYSKFLMPTIRGSEVGSKKRYAGLIGDEQSYEIIFKGLEAVRSDWSRLAKDFQQELYRRIFLGEPYEAFILETVQQVKAGESDDKLVFRKRLRRKLTEYQKIVPPHVKAARLAEAERASRGLNSASDFGGWIEYFMTVNGAEPKQYRQSRIDYQFYVDKQLAPIADAILSFQSKSLAGIIDQQLSLF